MVKDVRMESGIIISAKERLWSGRAATCHRRRSRWTRSPDQLPACQSQRRREVLRVDSIGLHHSPDNGLGQDLAQGWLAMSLMHRWTPHVSANGEVRAR